MNKLKLPYVLLVALFAVVFCADNLIRVPLSRSIGEQPITRTQKLLTDYHEERLRLGDKLDEFAIDTDGFGAASDVQINLKNWLNL